MWSLAHKWYLIQPKFRSFWVTCAVDLTWSKPTHRLGILSGLFNFPSETAGDSSVINGSEFSLDWFNVTLSYNSLIINVSLGRRWQPPQRFIRVILLGLHWHIGPYSWEETSNILPTFSIYCCKKNKITWPLLAPDLFFSFFFLLIFGKDLILV